MRETLEIGDRLVAPAVAHGVNSHDKTAMKNEKIIKKGNTMKNNRFSKILVFILSLALLIGSAVAVTVSAAESDETYDITAMNIVCADKTNVVVAVDATLEQANDVVVTYTIGTEGPFTATYWAEQSQDGFLVYYTKGISPKDLGLDVKIEAHSKSAADYVPDYESALNASVVEYLYSMLYGEEGLIDADEGLDLNRKYMYASMLSYANYAQEVLWNADEDNAGDQRDPLFDRVFVYAPEATVNGVGSEILLDGAGDVTLKYTGSENGIITWNITYYNDDGSVKSTTTKSGNTFAVTDTCVITASVYVNPNLKGFDDLGLADGTPVTGSFYDGKFKVNSGEAAIGTLNGSDALKIDGTDEVILYPVASAEGSNATVFEADFNINFLSTNFGALRFDWRSVSETDRFELCLGTPVGGQSSSYPSRTDVVNLGLNSTRANGTTLNTSNIDFIGGTFPGWPTHPNKADAPTLDESADYVVAGETFRLRLEYYWSVDAADASTGGRVKVYLNGNYIGFSKAPNCGESGESGMNAFRMRSAGSASVTLLDNVVYENVNLTFAE